MTSSSTRRASTATRVAGWRPRPSAAPASSRRSLRQPETEEELHARADGAGRVPDGLDRHGREARDEARSWPPFPDRPRRRRVPLRLPPRGELRRGELPDRAPRGQRAGRLAALRPAAGEAPGGAGRRADDVPDPPRRRRRPRALPPRTSAASASCTRTTRTARCAQSSAGSRATTRSPSPTTCWRSHVPGHTRGSACLPVARHASSSPATTSPGARDLERVYAFRGACWYDWDVQTESMRRLADHASSGSSPATAAAATSAPEMRARLLDTVEWMRER